MPDMWQEVHVQIYVNASPGILQKEESSLRNGGFRDRRIEF